MQTKRMTSVDAATLWERFHGELYAFLIPRVDSEAAAQDILQSAFLRAHKSLAAGALPEKPRAWLYQIVRNLIVDAHRHVGAQHALVEAFANERTAEADETAFEQEAFALVARALPMFIAELDPPYRDAVTMTELESLTQAEAAERAGVGVSTMKSRVQRGRKRLFDSLRRCCEFEVDARGRMTACKRHADNNECC